MPRRPNNQNQSRSPFTRRQILSTLGIAVSGGVAVQTLERSDAFETGGTDRSATANIADDSNGIISAVIADAVKKNQQDLLAQLTNNADVTVSVTVSLNTCADGTLYGPDGGSGCSVTFSITQGQTRDIYFEGANQGDVSFTISGGASTGFTFSLPRVVTVEAGNNTGTVTVDKLNQFKKQPADDDWTIKTLEVSSDSADLDRIELTVREQSSGDTVGELDITNIQGQQYSAKGTGNNPAIRIDPNNTGYTVQNNITYELTVVAFDVNGNTGIATATD